MKYFGVKKAYDDVSGNWFCNSMYTKERRFASNWDFSPTDKNMLVGEIVVAWFLSHQIQRQNAPSNKL